MLQDVLQDHYPHCVFYQDSVFYGTMNHLQGCCVFARNGSISVPCPSDVAVACKTLSLSLARNTNVHLLALSVRLARNSNVHLLDV